MASASPGSLAKKCLSIRLNSVNSTFFGSTNTNFNCAGCFLNNSETRMELIPTDLPCPVAPATSKCGILAKSAIKTSLLMVLPKAIGKSMVFCTHFSVFKMLRIGTISGCWLGTSIPMVPLPGIGAIIRIPKAASERAISSSRFLIFEILTPGAGIIS
ncbi:hypothetical protein D3C87_862150 [compost metagenome]